MLIPTLLTAATLLAGTTVSAASADAPPDPSQVVSWTVSSGEIIYDTHGQVQSRTASSPQTYNVQQAQPLASGHGGSSSAHGCGKIWVKNVGNTVLGNVAYIFWTSTYRCWKRGLHRIYNVSNSWKISNMDGEEQWKGIVQYKHHFYHWLAGYPRSGYYHYRQGHFTNCVFHYGCVSDSYPVNTIAAHSNGTFKWKANGAA